jgi:predicted nucleic acid-binding protein
VATVKSAGKVVLCDASPLIFLAKLNRLDLIERSTEARVIVLRCVVHEVLSARAALVETERLRAWFATVEVVDYEGSLFESQALSLSDRTSLAWAFEHTVDWFLVDERLLRRFAKERGIRVIGFCGLMLKAAEQGILTKSEVLTLLDTSIREHGFRISVQLYQHIRERVVGLN